MRAKSVGRVGNSRPGRAAIHPLRLSSTALFPTSQAGITLALEVIGRHRGLPTWESLGNTNGCLYSSAMTTIKTIPAEKLSSLDVHEGDTLHILAHTEAAFLIEISRTETVAKNAPGKASEWVRSARGSVRLAADETANDVRMEYYAGKYGLNP